MCPDVHDAHEVGGSTPSAPTVLTCGFLNGVGSDTRGWLRQVLYR